MRCAGNACQQGRRDCPTPGYCRGDSIYTTDDVFAWVEELLICAAAVLALLVVALPLVL